MQRQCVSVPIREGMTERLADWVRGLERRHDEVLEAMAGEGIRRELVLLERRADGDRLLIYTESPDLVAANAAFQSSTAPVDVEFRALMAETLDFERAELVEVMLAAHGDET